MARAFGGALLLLGVGGVIIAAVEIALFWSLEGPVWLYSLFSLTGLVYLTAGLAAWWRRPSNYIGAIIVLSGGVWLAAALVQHRRHCQPGVGHGDGEGALDGRINRYGCEPDAGRRG